MGAVILSKIPSMTSILVVSQIALTTMNRLSFTSRKLAAENPSKQLSLNLSWCVITDVSALGAVHTLDLSNCNKITDVSAPCGVHTPTLT